MRHRSFFVYLMVALFVCAVAATTACKKAEETPPAVEPAVTEEAAPAEGEAVTGTETAEGEEPGAEAPEGETPAEEPAEGEGE